MKSFRILILFLLYVFIGSCVQTDDNAKVIPNEYIEVIRRGDFNGIYNSFESSRKGLIDSGDFRILFYKIHDIVRNSIQIDSNSVRFQNKKMITISGIQNVKTYTYKVVYKDSNSKDSTIYLTIAVTGSSLYNLGLSELSPGIHFLEPPKTPHLNAFNLDIEDVSWFRIWYQTGKESNSYGDQYGYYAISGKKNKLVKCYLYEPLNEILEGINKVEFDSLDHKSMGSHSAGRAEFINIRMKFKNPPYNDLGEIEILYLLAEEPGIQEPDFEYILLIHSQSTRYFINKNKYPELAELLTSMGRKEYDGCLEFRFH